MAIEYLVTATGLIKPNKVYPDGTYPIHLYIRNFRSIDTLADKQQFEVKAKSELNYMFGSTAWRDMSVDFDSSRNPEC